MRRPARKRATPNLNADLSDSKVQGGFSKNASSKKEETISTQELKRWHWRQEIFAGPLYLPSFSHKGKEAPYTFASSYRKCPRGHSSMFPNWGSPMLPAKRLREAVPGAGWLPAWKKAISFFQEKLWFRDSDGPHSRSLSGLITQISNTSQNFSEIQELADGNCEGSPVRLGREISQQMFAIP